MRGIPQGRHIREFRQEAVKLITEEKLSLHKLPVASNLLDQ
ncbi:MAG: hypothetical protein WC369_05510 [Dehalococcoidales bacterium]|jgi:hypothetical protein